MTEKVFRNDIPINSKVVYSDLSEGECIAKHNDMCICTRFNKLTNDDELIFYDPKTYRFFRESFGRVKSPLEETGLKIVMIDVKPR